MYMLRTCRLLLFKNKKLSLYRLKHCLIPFMWTAASDRKGSVVIKLKKKAVPLQAWSGPEGSRKLRFPDYMTTAQDGGKVVSLTPAAFTPKKCSWYSFLLQAESTPGP
jgi:hypothetical protein